MVGSSPGPTRRRLPGHHLHRRGFGRSDKPLTGYSYECLTEDLCNLIKSLDLHDITLVGSSMGGGEIARRSIARSERRDAHRGVRLCKQASKEASLACMATWASTAFRDDRARVSVPALIIHGESDESVPLHGSARRTHAAIPGSELRVIADGPHGCHISHPEEFNAALLDFLAR